MIKEILKLKRNNMATKTDVYGGQHFHFTNIDIDLIVRLLHQELDAVHTVMENTKDGYTPIEWYDRADQLEDLIMAFLR